MNDTVIQFRPREAPLPANDAAPLAVKAAKRVDWKAVGRSAGRGGLAAGRGVLLGSLYLARVSLFVVLSLGRIVVRPVCSLVAVVGLLASPFIWFGYASDPTKQLHTTAICLGMAFGGVLIRFAYDELLALLSPSRNQVSG